MKNSTLFSVGFIITLIAVMLYTNFVLKKEYQKIDLTDSFKNYISITTKPYSILSLSGSNGYPIEIVKKTHNNIKVLRSRESHFKSSRRGDTLFIEFSGSDISMQQARFSDIPYGIIIETSLLNHIISADTHTIIRGFSGQDLTLTLQNNSLTQFFDCSLKTMFLTSRNNSQFEFSKNNSAEHLNIAMSEKSIGYFQEVTFSTINHTLKDSTTFVLSKETFRNILK